MTIDDRIAQHEEIRHRLMKQKEMYEAELARTNQKIIYHWAAIQNLVRKKLRCKKDDT